MRRRQLLGAVALTLTPFVHASALAPFAPAAVAGTPIVRDEAELLAALAAGHREVRVPWGTAIPLTGPLPSSGITFLWHMPANHEAWFSATAGEDPLAGSRFRNVVMGEG